MRIEEKNRIILNRYIEYKNFLFRKYNKCNYGRKYINKKISISKSHPSVKNFGLIL